MRKTIGTIAAAVIGAALLATGAAAKDGDVLVAGTCTGPSTAKLKLSDEDVKRLEEPYKPHAVADHA